MKTLVALKGEPGNPARKRGFTLVELLVVIAIIAILAALLLPVLASTKLKATQATCLSNQKQLMLALLMYSSQNDDKIVGYGGMDGYIYPGVASGSVPASWNINGLNSDQAVDRLTKALSAPNIDPLFKFANNIGIIHCPGDTRYKYRQPGNGWAFDSYSKTQNIGGENNGNYWGAGATYTTVSSVAVPSLTFAFREDVDSRGFNEGTWVVNWSLNQPQAGHPQSFTWEDPIPMYHGNVSTSAFVDGHVEAYAYGDSDLVSYGKTVAAGTTSPGANRLQTHYGTPDYEYIYQGYRFPGWQP